jgi:hypothetical protein
MSLLDCSQLQIVSVGHVISSHDLPYVLLYARHGKGDARCNPSRAKHQRFDVNGLVNPDALVLVFAFILPRIGPNFLNSLAEWAHSVLAEKFVLGT